MAEIIKATFGSVCFEWYDWKEKEIDIDKYSGFTVEYRLGSWYVLGHYYDKDYDKWKTENIGDGEISISSLVPFIIDVESRDKYIKAYSNLHCWSGFTDKLCWLLSELQKEKEKRAARAARASQSEDDDF